MLQKSKIIIKMQAVVISVNEQIKQNFAATSLKVEHYTITGFYSITDSNNCRKSRSKNYNLLEHSLRLKYET